MAPEIKARWKKEINWLLSVTDHIVEFVASQQKSKDGTNMEVIRFSLFSFLSSTYYVAVTLRSDSDF